MITIFLSASSRRAKVCQTIRNELEQRHDILVTSHWIDLVLEGEPDYDLEQKAASWNTNLREIAEASAFVLLAHEDDTLRGSLIELGMATALGKPIIILGELVPEHFNHRTVVLRCQTMREVINYLKTHLDQKSSTDQPKPQSNTDHTTSPPPSPKCLKPSSDEAKAGSDSTPPTGKPSTSSPPE